MFSNPINIKIHRGVRQGDFISPNLFFRTTLENMLSKINLVERKNIYGGKLQILLFADDIVLIAEDLKN